MASNFTVRQLFDAAVVRYGRRHKRLQLSRWRSLQRQHVPARRSVAQQVRTRGLCGARLPSDRDVRGAEQHHYVNMAEEGAASAIKTGMHPLLPLRITTPWCLRCRTTWSRSRKSIRRCTTPCGRVSAWGSLTRPAGSQTRNSLSKTMTRPSTDGWCWSRRPITCGSDLIVYRVGSTLAEFWLFY